MIFDIAVGRNFNHDWHRRSKGLLTKRFLVHDDGVDSQDLNCSISFEVTRDGGQVVE